MTAPTIVRRRERIAPSPRKLTNTLLDSITVTEGIEWGEPTGLYTSFNCVPTDAVTAMCPDAHTTKTFTGPTIIDGFRVAVYTGFTCKLVGLSREEQQAEVERIINLRESFAVEKALMQDRFTGLVGGAAATDLTPAGGAVAPKVGLAILEGDAPQHYAGSPTIHAPRTIASLLFADGMADTDSSDGTLRTPLGSLLVAGGGYDVNNGPTAAAPAAGEMWVYATGEVSAARSTLVTANELNRGTNDNYVLGERIYVLDVDCYVAAVRVKIA